MEQEDGFGDFDDAPQEEPKVAADDDDGFGDFGEKDDGEGNDQDGEDGFGDFGEFQEDKATDKRTTAVKPTAPLDDDPFASILGEYGISDAKPKPVFGEFGESPDSKKEENMNT